MADREQRTRRLLPRLMFGLIVLAGSVATPLAWAVDATSSAPLCGRRPLDILLTNDDGYASSGIRALYQALRKAGHHVLLSAPMSNASGSSASFTWTPVRVVRDPEDPNVLGVAGSPATAVVLGATAIRASTWRPDLVVSGINDGANTGPLLSLSGTVGAALAGTMLLSPPVPGIAVSADRVPAAEAGRALPADHLAQVARHLVQLIETTRSWYCEHGQVVHPMIVLNVNYPARALTDTKGTVLASPARTSDIRLAFAPTEADTYAVQVSRTSKPAGAPDSDGVLLAQGYVTVTPVAAVREAREVPLEDLARRLTR